MIWKKKRLNLNQLKIYLGNNLKKKIKNKNKK
jgi:hypothetical protein